ncbi:hypothetical protein V9T40_011134 [Parthenolecanium corni]|uniref:SOCS box domain-containing protein n=1 Tax=Parthenolecanium corni TaxID=536013 RepID=A0AAN9XZ71_9HEMI
MSIPTDSISSSIQRGDRSSMLQLLEELKKNRLPLPASSTNWTALHLAASQPQYKEYLELLLEYSDSILMDINGLTDDGTTALHIACENGCEESVLILLQKGCDPYKVTSDDNDSALHIAAGKGNSKIIEYLLNYPRNINEPNMWGMTPLHFAAEGKGNLEVGRILLEKGVNVRVHTENGNSPLHYACGEDNLDMIRFLVECDSTLINCMNLEYITPLMLAAKCSSDGRSVRILYENGAQTGPYNCRENGGMALHFAVDGGKVEVLEYMLQFTETSCIEAWVSSAQNVLHMGFSEYIGVFSSLLCRTIDKGNVECLEMLLSSNKLSPSILQAPNIERYDDNCEIYSPLAYLFKNKCRIEDEKFNSYLKLLLKNKIVMLDEFFKVYEVEWPECEIQFHSPFTYILNEGWPFSKIQHYFHLLHANDITIDYSLQCYHDNTQSFATFTNYEWYYQPVIRVMLANNIEVLNLIVPNSAILEPDVMILQYHKLVDVLWNRNGVVINEDAGFLQFKEKYHSLFEYLMSLKPTYYKQPETYDRLRLLLYPYNTIGEEFSKSTLKQLCRTVIRQHLRESTLEGNLRHFHRKILELPLPTLLKDYLLFKY